MEKIFKVMHSTDIEGVEFAAYQLKDITYQWYEELEHSQGNMLNRLCEGSFLLLSLVVSFLRS